MTEISPKRRAVGERTFCASTPRPSERRQVRPQIPAAGETKAQQKAAVRQPHPTTDLCVMGLGYIGLPTAAVFAEAGLSVLGVDIDSKRVADVNAGKCVFDEVGLSDVLAQAVARGRLRAANQPEAARAFIIAVPTPLTTGKQPDLSHVHAAATAIAPVLTRGALVVLESTVPVGATAHLAAQLSALRPDLCFPGDLRGAADVQVVHCPERVLPGQILKELRENDRVIGGLDEAGAAKGAELFARVSTGKCHVTDAATAEITKLAENAYRDVNIAFANELAAIAEAQNIDPRTIIALANRHPRVQILDPGPGVGGHCIAVDPWFLAASSCGRARLIPTARTVNDARPTQIAAQVAELADGLDDPVIACFGLAYKRDVADLRESPAVHVTRLLAGLHPGRVLAIEPHIEELPGELTNAKRGVALVDVEQAVAKADIAVLLVDHSAFSGLQSRLHQTLCVDTRGLWTDPKRTTAGAPDSIPSNFDALLNPAKMPSVRRQPSLHRNTVRAVNYDRAPVRQ